MDQDSSNGAGADKRNWRERLGIGAKELPKLSDEFRDEAAVPPAPAAGNAKPAPRAPQPVTRPAPMAPRVAAKPAAASESPAPPAAPPPTPAAPVSRATPRAPDNATQDALADKLRAQRAAAERLAEQRVQAARNRAEARPKVEPARPAAAPPLRPTAAPAPAARSAPVAPSAGAARPKFSFADDSRGEQPARPGLSGTSAPLTPPRPPLGGERSQPPFLRPTPANGSLAARPQSTFRPPTEGGSAGYASPPRLQAPGASRQGLGSEAAGYGAARLPVRRPPPPPPPALDTYARQPEPRDYPEDDYQDEGRSPPRLGRPGGAPRGRAPQDDFDEVFEEDQAPRGRAGARDYQNAYNEVEDAFADEPRRSSGPWLLLLALLAAAVLTGVVVWFYSDNVRNLAGMGSSSSSTSDSAPVVPAPAEPAKISAPEPGGEGQTESPSRKKQIYDRIVGEQEVMGDQQMQPTEEMPVLPADAQPADQVPTIEPAGSANPIPVPDAQNQGATGEGLPEVEPPPPLPIPGSDQQGSLGLKGTGQQIAAASAQPELGSTAPPPPPPPSAASAKTTSSDASLPPPPETATDGAAFVSGTGAAGSGAAADQTASASAVVTPDDDPETGQSAETAQPAKKATQTTTQQPAATKKKTQTAKTQPTKKSTSKQPDFDNLGAAPVVLVPPSEQAVAESGAGSGAATAATEGQQPATPAATPQKRKSIFDLFNGSGSGSSTATETAPTQVASAAQQTKQAAKPVQQKATTPPAQQASTGGGYVVQLASYRTESEAKSEYTRLAKAYPGVVGSLRSQIRQTSVAGSTRYQLGLGPLPTRGDATRVCGELIASGESDCIIRGP